MLKHECCFHDGGGAFESYHHHSNKNEPNYIVSREVKKWNQLRNTSLKSTDPSWHLSPGGNSLTQISEHPDDDDTGLQPVGPRLYRGEEEEKKPHHNRMWALTLDTGGDRGSGIGGGGRTIEIWLKPRQMFYYFKHLPVCEFMTQYTTQGCQHIYLVICCPLVVWSIKHAVVGIRKKTSNIINNTWFHHVHMHTRWLDHVVYDTFTWNHLACRSAARYSRHFFLFRRSGGSFSGTPGGDRTYSLNASYNIM